MSNIIFKELRKDDKNTVNIYKLACDWDSKNMWKTTKFDDLELHMYFSRIIILYDDDNIIGLGSICYYPIDHRNYITISYIIRPQSRRKGYATILINKLIDIISNTYNVENVRVEILKKNIASISLIEKNNFEFVNFDKEKIVFEKKLKL